MSKRGGSRRSSRRGRLALRIGMICAFPALAGAMLAVVLVVQTLGPQVGSEARDLVGRAWLLGGVIALLAALATAIVAYVQGAGVAQRLTDLGIAVNKLGRGSSEVRVRISGDDEVAGLGRSIQYVATDLAAMFQQQEQQGSLSAAFDPQVRALRDRTLPQALPAAEGYELAAEVSHGTRGGLDYFDGVAASKAGAGEAGADGDGDRAGGLLAVLFLVSAEGTGPLSVVACRMARDELLRALNAGAAARKALSHTNRVLNRQLPRGVCAKATLLEVAADQVKVYQAGFRVPCLVCARGEVQEVAGEGLALGLDEGPVFEKGLRPATVPVSQGVRMVLANEAGHRIDRFRELVRSHSPKHTAAFMNMVLGGIEEASAASGDGDGLREDVVLLTVKRW